MAHKKNTLILIVVTVSLFFLLSLNEGTAAALGQPTLTKTDNLVEAKADSTYLSHPDCLPKQVIPRFVNEQQVTAHGYHFQVFGPGGSYAFEREGRTRYLSLKMDTFPFDGELTASRITEIDTSLPPEERVFCWQPTETEDVVVEYTHRFAEAPAPPGLIENLFLWNASIQPGDLITAVGVTRSEVLGGYFAIVAQDFDFLTNTGLLALAPMPAWVDPTSWHTIEIVLSQEDAVIKVEQNGNSTTLLQTDLLQPTVPLGFEFSVDNQIFPGVIVPVTVADQIDVAFYGAGLRHR